LICDTQVKSLFLIHRLHAIGELNDAYIAGMLTAMPLPVINNVVRVAVEGHTSLGTKWANVIHLAKTAGTAAIADFPALVTELNRLYGGATYGGGGLNLLNNTNSSTAVDRYVFTILNGTAASVPLAATAAGSGAVAAVPAEVAAVITLRTGLRGRSFRGRIYLPAFTTAAFTSTGQISSGVVTALPIQCSGFNTALVALTYTWVVASYLHATAQPITSWTMDNAPDVQRRRKA